MPTILPLQKQFLNVLESSAAPSSGLREVGLKILNERVCLLKMQMAAFNTINRGSLRLTVEKLQTLEECISCDTLFYLASSGAVFNLASSGAVFNLASFFHFRLGRWRPWRRWRQSTRHRQCEWGTSTPRPSPLLNSLRRNPSARRLVQSYVSFAITCLFVLYTECFLRDIIPFWVKIFPFCFKQLQL